MLLRKDDPWLVDLPIPDIRDWRVLDAGGQTVGFVQSLAVDPRAMVVEAVLTGANDRFPGTDIEIVDNVVRLKQRLNRRRPVGRPTTSDRFRGFEEAYCDHFERAYGEGEGAAPNLAYDALESAYAFGRTTALDADYQRRPFRIAEEDVRAEYAARGLTPAYGLAREAVRFGYELAQPSGTYEPAGMEREWMQILGTDETATDDVVRTGSGMDTGEPAENAS